MGAVGQSSAGLLAVFWCGGGAGFYLQWSTGGLEVMGGVGEGAVVDCLGPVAGADGIGSADQSHGSDG
ncbi:hypothetical protein D3C77_795200 [compost metagenome]